jgi:hypothetical protein
MNYESLPPWDFRLFLIKFTFIILRYEDPVSDKACEKQLG